MTIIVWFRQDLRLADNPALHAASTAGDIIPVFVFENGDKATAPDRRWRPMGAASRWWLHHSLDRLARRLGKLVLVSGDPLAILPELVRESGASAVYWNRRYEPYAILGDRAVNEFLTGKGVDVRSFNGALLAEPWEIKNKQGGPFKVYSPFWRRLRSRSTSAPLNIPTFKISENCPVGVELSDLGLLPQKPNWATGWEDLWQPGETGALARLDRFIDAGLQGYKDLRDRPDRDNVSRLSPHLHFGEISPRQIWARLEQVAADHPSLDRDASKFLSELAWREFSYYLLYHFPALAEENWRAAFDAYPWREAPHDLAAWKKGRTGYPIVDAGMRELWQTGYMHNRVRMVVASFLVKHLRIHWREGEAWFWDTLVDADLANNASSWQWVAGSGADAAPYFRIFNPITQGRKFDPDGNYVRHWCPELSKLDKGFIHAPFEAPAETLEVAGVRLGETYPLPIVEHRQARAAALRGYDAVKAAGKG